MILAVDLGGTTTKAALVSDGKIIDRSQSPVNPQRSLAAELKRLEAMFYRICQGQHLLITQCLGIALSLACLVNPLTRKVLKASAGKFEDGPHLDLPGWAESLGLTLTTETDSRCNLIGEWQFGVGKGYQNIVMITLGTAIGVAVLIQGKLLRGRHFQAGLGGHLIVSADGRRCNCGGQGCLTAEASTWALPGIVHDRLKYRDSSLKNVKEEINYQILFERAAGGDELASEIRNHSLLLWSSAVVSLIHLFDPEIVILGGGIMNSGEMIIPYVRDFVNRQAWTPWGKVKIVRAHHLSDAALLGASYLFQNPVEAI